ncbi:MAG: alkaline phosphatase family protein, partial [Chloroflexota bacterium]
MSHEVLRRDDLEQMFSHRRISRGTFVSALAALGISAAGIESIAGSLAISQAQVPTPKYLVVMVMDAFRPDYTSLAPMPALTRLAQSGISFNRAWVGQLESETPPGHVTISTGSRPQDDGLIGFEWRDPATQQEILDGWPKGVIAGDMERDVRASGANSIPLAVKADDPAAKVVALSSEKVYAADGMGGWAADYILFHQRSGPGNKTLTPAGVQGHLPPASFIARPELHLQLPARKFTDWDYLSGMLALASLEDFQPKVLMVNFPGADVYGHPYGGPATPAVLSKVAAGIDRNIDRIVQAYRKAGIYDQTLFVLTADHGMVPNDRAVDGATTKATVRQSSGNYFFHTGGTMAAIYLHNRFHARAVSAGMSKVPGVAGSYFQHTVNGKYIYESAPGLRIDTNLDAAYRYLLSTIQGPTAPDVIAPFRENTIGTVDTHAHGDHGGLNWGAQHIPLIISGPGVQAGVSSDAPARLMDIAPTILRLLNLPVHDMDGIVLA